MSVIDNFKALAAIPRESGNEAGIRAFLVKWADEHHLENVVDSCGNVIIYAPATKGFEDAPAVALQGHMDMVCVKKAGSKHNFLTDPIELVQDGDIMHAKDTSMGADNGIAIAMIMDIFTDGKCQHGKLEAICTVNEEVGLSGAFGLDSSLVSARKMINLDSEEEGVIYIGCAGGKDVEAVFCKPQDTLCDCCDAMSLEVCGLKSGHSGGEIHLQRANAIKVVARMMHEIGKKFPFKMVSFDGGTKHNAIPAQARIVFVSKKENLPLIKDELLKYAKAIKAENRYEEPDMQIIVEKAPKGEKGFSKEDTKAFIDSLFMAPHGVLAMSKALKGVVQTSCNLAIVKTEGNTISVCTSIRSNIESQRDAAAERMAMILATSSADVKLSEGYPAWDPDPNSKLAEFCAKAWEDQTGRKPLVTAIHAGLECGIINSKIPGMDSVSIGPDLKNVHTVNECFSVSSVERMVLFTKHLLSIIR